METETRLLRKTLSDVATQCLLWQGYRDKNGYGRLSLRNRPTHAHRAAYEEWVGPIPAGHHVHHRCENPSCINPAHLQAVTVTEHARLTPRHPMHRTHCPAGHELTGANLQEWRLRSTGVRGCRACATARAAARRSN